MISWYDLGVGALIGAVIGYGISLHFARKSSRELQNEAADLRKLSQILIHGMERAGWVKVTRDGDGRVQGMVVEVQLTGQGMVTLQGKLGVRGDIQIK